MGIKIKRVAPPGSPTDFRGTGLEIGSMVVHSSGGRSNSMYESVVIKLGPQRASLAARSTIVGMEKQAGAKITTVEELLALKPYSSSRMYRNICCIGHMEDQ